MKLRGRPAGRLLASLVTALCAPAGLLAQPLDPGSESTGLTTYTVLPGDTCSGIARRLFRDARRVDLIHAVNNLGPLPHRLNAGTVLRVPRRATNALSAIPDAVLSSLGGEVEVLSPARHQGRRNDPLFRGNQVSTHERSSAEITFLDESQIRVQENTLVVILGDTSGRARATATARDTTLVSGGLRAWLGALAGRPDTVSTLSIQTPAGRVTLGQGEAAVRVGPSRRTTLAVYRGSSRMSTRRHSVTVSQGFSVAAEPDAAAPLVLRALPAAPAWQSVAPGVIFGRAELTLRWRAGAFVLPAGWHVQVARDPSFVDLATDERLGANVTEMVAREFTPGSWHIRVSALDADGVESPYSTEMAVRVVEPRVVPTERAHRSVIELPEGLFCGIDDAALSEVTAGLPVERMREHQLRCAASREGREAAELTVEPERLAPLTVTASMLGANARARVGRVRLRVLADTAEPVAGREVLATASAGVTVGRAIEYEEPGVYVLPVRWAPGTRSLSLHLSVGQDGCDTRVLALPQAPVAQPEPISFAQRLSVSLDALAGTTLSEPSRGALALSAGAALGIDLADALAVTASAREWSFSGELVPTGLLGTFALGLRASVSLSARLRWVIEAEAGAAVMRGGARFTLGLATGLGLGLTRSLTLGPMLRYGQVVEPGTAVEPQSRDEDARFWALGVRLGLRFAR